MVASVIYFPATGSQQFYPLHRQILQADAIAFHEPLPVVRLGRISQLAITFRLPLVCTALL